MKAPESSDAAPRALSDSAAKRVLARASELDAVHTSQISIANLRAAAAEAGISVNAFDAALAEHQDRVHKAVAAPPPPARRIPFSTLLLAGVLLAGGLVVLSFTWVPVSARVPVTEEAISLRCLPVSEAVDLIKPLLDGTATVRVLGSSPHTLRVRATTEQLQKVKSAIDANDGAESPACKLKPKP